MPRKLPSTGGAWSTLIGTGVLVVLLSVPTAAGGPVAPALKTVYSAPFTGAVANTTLVENGTSGCGAGLAIATPASFSLLTGRAYLVANASMRSCNHLSGYAVYFANIGLQDFPLTVNSSSSQVLVVKWRVSGWANFSASGAPTTNYRTRPAALVQITADLFITDTATGRRVGQSSKTIFSQTIHNRTVQHHFLGNVTTLGGRVGVFAANTTYDVQTYLSVIVEVGASGRVVSGTSAYAAIKMLQGSPLSAIVVKG